MAALRLLAGAVLFWSAPAAAQQGSPWRDFIAEASLRFDVPVAWINRVMRIESSGNAQLGGRPIVSPAGAMGLMQLMPGTWAEMRVLAGLGADPFDPHDNILAGALYLHLLYRRFGYPGLFGAYNAGPARYRRFLLGGRPLPAETVRYLREAADPGVVPTSPSQALFVYPDASPSIVAEAAAASSLFAVRKGE